MPEVQALVFCVSQHFRCDWYILKARLSSGHQQFAPLSVTQQFSFDIFTLFISSLSPTPGHLYSYQQSQLKKIILISRYWLLLRWISRFIDLRANIYQSNLQSIISFWNNNLWCSRKYKDNLVHVHWSSPQPTLQPVSLPKKQISKLHILYRTVQWLFLL